MNNSIPRSDAVGHERLRSASAKLAVLLLAMLSLLAVAAGRQQSDGLALVIGIDNYPKLGAAALSGAQADARSMQELAGLVAGYKVTPLIGPGAKLAAVKEWMEDALDDPDAKRALVYFSGYGSVAKNTDKESRYALVPSLVLADSDKDGGNHDLALSQLEEWAHEFVSRRGRSLTVIIDASYMPVPNVSRDFESSQWKAAPKCFVRDKSIDPASVRPVVWDGDGTCLCATPTVGGAYEMVNSLDNWHGVFTQTLMEWAEPEMVAREKPSARDVIRQISLVLKPVVGRSYLIGENVIGYPIKGPRLGEVFLTDQVAASGLPSEMVQVAQQTKKLQGRFKIALDSDNEHVAQLNAIAKKLQASIPDVYICERNQLPDRVIEVGTDRVHPDQPQAGDLHLQSGEASELDDVNDFDSSTEWPMFETRLLKSWYGLALFRSAMDRAKSPRKNDEANWIARTDQTTYHPSDTIKFQFTSSQAGAVLLLYRDDSDGFVDDFYPEVGAPNMNVVQQGETTFDPGFGFEDNSPATQTDLACYYISPSLFTPSLDNVMKENERRPSRAEAAQFDAEMVKVLHDLLVAVQAGKPGWASCVWSYRLDKS